MEDKNNFDILAKHFKRYFSGYVISKALLEDYAEVIGKIEGTDAKTVKDRIMKRAEEIRKEVVDALPKDE